MKIISQTNINDASKILRSGGIIAFPTETVFGLGVIYDNEKSYRRLISVKKRPPEKPFTLMCANPEDIYRFAEVGERADKLIKTFVPGELTIILKAKRNLPKWVVSQEGNVGIRVPNLTYVRELINDVGAPLLVPSANKSGESPYTNSNDVYWGFTGEIDAVVEGNSQSNIPSTIVIVGEDVKIIREGSITKEMINKVLEEAK